MASGQVERNLHDAMGVARNVLLDPRLVPGGGAVEMAISRGLADRAASLLGTEQACSPSWDVMGCLVHDALWEFVLMECMFRELIGMPSGR